MKMVRAFALMIAMLLISNATLLAGAGGATPANTPDTKPTIFVCGDSTSKYNGGETMDNLRQLNGQPMAGWGTPIARFFDPAKVAVNNVGHAGTSSRTYYYGDWPRVLPMIKAGDYVLLVFGINEVCE